MAETKDAAEVKAREVVSVEVMAPAHLSEEEKKVWVLERHTPAGVQVVKPGQTVQMQRHEAESLERMGAGKVK